MLENILRQFLQTQLLVTKVRRLVVGFSAGLDSMALLHALGKVAAEFGLPVAAIHVHHGLSPNADAWAEHAAQACAARHIALTVQRVSVGQGASLEAEARAARYAAFRACLQEGDALLLAQHQDDQAETVLFRLARGAGVRGLGAMHACRELTLSQGPSIPLWRPLLTVSRRSLEQYADAEQLHWVDDESNTDTRYTRNFLRQDIIPALRTHWPAVSRTLAATAARMQEADELLAEYAELLMAPLRLEHGALSVGGLLALTLAQRKQVLRHWLHEKNLRVPEEKILDQLEGDVLNARVDAMPVLAWSAGEFRRYRDGLYAMAPLPDIPPFWEASWQGEELLLPDGRRLRSNTPLHGAPLTVRFRQGGERIKPAGAPHTRELKTLMQEAGIPPWERERIPLVFAGEELVLVVGWWGTEAWPQLAHVVAQAGALQE